MDLQRTLFSLEVGRRLCSPNVPQNALQWPRPISCEEQAFGDGLLKFKLEIKYWGHVLIHSCGTLWHGGGKRGTLAPTHGSVQTRWKNEQQGLPCSPPKVSGPGNFTGESCEHVKAHVVLKHLSCFRTQGKKEILQISFIKDLDIKPDQDYTKRKKEKKKEPKSVK